jgi:SEC-C motif-containing protein
MRSRYCSFVFLQVDYLLETTHPKTRKYYSDAAIRNWAKQLKWVDLIIHEAKDSTVKFNARYIDEKGILQEHKEFSTFETANGKWYFLDGIDWE